MKPIPEITESLSSGNYRAQPTTVDMAIKRTAEMRYASLNRHVVRRNQDMRYVTFDKGSVDRSDINGM